MNSEELLDSKKLRKTALRMAVVNVLSEKEQALSQVEIENLLEESPDRVSLYRTLRSFEEKGLIHKVSDFEGTVRFALCSTSCSNHEHVHEHVHFKCNTCGQTQCIESARIPELQLPNGFVAEERQLFISGTCSRCS